MRPPSRSRLGRVDTTTCRAGHTGALAVVSKTRRPRWRTTESVVTIGIRESSSSSSAREEPVQISCPRPPLLSSSNPTVEPSIAPRLLTLISDGLAGDAGASESYPTPELTGGSSAPTCSAGDCARALFVGSNAFACTLRTIASNTSKHAENSERLFLKAVIRKDLLETMVGRLDRSRIDRQANAACNQEHHDANTQPSAPAHPLALSRQTSRSHDF